MKKYILFVLLTLSTSMSYGQLCLSSSYQKRFYSQFSASYLLIRDGNRNSNETSYRFNNQIDNLSGRKGLNANLSMHYFLIPESLTIGTGLGFYRNIEPNFNYVPLTIDLRYHIFQEYKALYFGIQYGQSVINSAQLNRAYHVEFKLGYLMRVFKEQVYGIEVGYRGTNTSYSEDSFRFSDDTANMSGFTFTINYFLMQ